MALHAPLSLPPSISSSPSNIYKIIKIDVNEAKLKDEIKGKFYLHVFVKEGLQLCTKPARCSTPLWKSWNQKFVFSVPAGFAFDEESTVSFTLFKKRKWKKWLLDPSVGKATAQLKSLYPVEDVRKNFDSGGGGVCEYDTDDGEHNVVDFRGEKDRRENFELKADVLLPLLNKWSTAVGTLSVGVTAWEKYEANYLGREKKSFAISKGSESFGVLTTGKAEEKTCLSDVKWPNLAMEYEEFMMEKASAGKPKRSLKIFS